MSFTQRYNAQLTTAPPVSLQVVLPTSLGECGLTPEHLGDEVRAYHPSMTGAVTEGASGTDPAVAALVGGGGPPLAWAGLVRWGDHTIRVAAFDGPMPYGPVASCVRPALLPPEVKADAEAHRSHVLLDHAGPASDPFERYLALMAVAGSVARFGATAVLNEDARTSCPAFDLIPDDGEDGFATLRSLPLCYLMVGFVRTSVGAPENPWARTFNAHRFGLPDLAYRAAGHGEWGSVFQWFSALLGYARETSSTLAAGQAVTLDGGEAVLALNAPPVLGGDLLESDGDLLVVTRAQNQDV